ncbi:alpha-glucan family phosphorylase [Paracoccus benzoatiresistens]|uniref:glycogen phosphorylase n=1 Tax=Paracoccus benzoatiresistens TaxID=2997341 RepID=A0ABT4JAI5_9RHOB|nr:alpha-glucan family phosphorylase [Paracoccus sp. EF6]MCZ0964067.1 alpha-glucan family phosphorylase [Paracoccus sp. EF6]
MAAGQPGGLDGSILRCRIAYLSMEIAIQPEMHTYAGGLGVLAGDTARTAADLDLPMVFLTLASHEGYLRQEIDDAGQQIDHPDPWTLADWATPLDAAVAVRIEGRPVWVRPWVHVLAGPGGHKVPILLLDTRLQVNDPADQMITDRLYGGDETMRLKQEMVLGIGGERLLAALGFAIETFHLNEGHAALLAAERLRRYPAGSVVQSSDCLRHDVEQVRSECVFTTHTPVEAGHDRFRYDTSMRLLGNFMELYELQLLAGTENLNMTRLALSLSGFVNGVARAHGATARRMFPGYRIRDITNGIHAGTWAHPAMARLFDEVAPGWRHAPEELVNADQLSDGRIWKAHQEAKAELIAYAAEKTGVLLRADLPLVGYARRMTGYKRLELIFSDLQRLRMIARDQPFQLVMAGKAHPRDTAGKELIRSLHENMRMLSPDLPAAFLGGYDMEVAKRFVSGADVWLNTPLPPLEASGTSGMKAALNGGLNLSVLDGWWAEAWVEGVTGWAITGDDPAGHADALYEKLSRTVLPLYFDNRERWIWMMKEALSKIGSRFNSQQMMRRYASEAYLR